jgi:hypothetical protein
MLIILQRGYGRVVNVSCSGGRSQPSRDEPRRRHWLQGCPERPYWERVLGGDVKVDAIYPGWVRMDMRVAPVRRARPRKQLTRLCGLRLFRETCPSSNTSA